LAGIATLISALTTRVAAALVYREEFCIATTLRAASMLLLEMESHPWRGLTATNPPEEILMLPKFLLLTRLIRPACPNWEFASFHLNMARTWLLDGERPAEGLLW
jgi:hypothetical protein